MTPTVSPEDQSSAEVLEVEGEIIDSPFADEWWWVPWGAQSEVACCGTSRTSWLLTWRDSFLHIGYGEYVSDRGTRLMDESQLMSRASIDGLVWTTPEVFAVPDIHFPVPEVSDWVSRWSDRWTPCRWFCTAITEDSRLRTGSPLSTIFDIVSNKERLLVGSQWQDKVYVSITSDLLEWETIDFTLPEPEDTHKQENAASRAIDLEIGPNGWLVTVRTVQYLDWVLVLPKHMRELSDDFAITTFGIIEAHEKALLPYEGNCPIGVNLRLNSIAWCLQWEELEVDKELHGYIYVPNKPYHYDIRGSVWSALWGSRPIESQMPSVGIGICCQIVGTNEGYFAIKETAIPGYGPGIGTPSEIFFSPDGVMWNRVEYPHGEDTWIHAFVALEDGIMALESSDFFLFYMLEEDAISTVWKVGPDGLNWSKIGEVSHQDIVAAMEEYHQLIKPSQALLNSGSTAIMDNIIVRFKWSSEGGLIIERRVYSE